MKIKNKILSSAIAGVMALSMVGSLGVSAADSSSSLSAVTSEAVSDTSYETVTSYDSSVNVISQIHALKSPFPHYQQPVNSNLCWAECARAIVNYMLGTSYTNEDMITTVNNLKFNYGIGDYVSEDLSASYESTYETIRYYLQTRGYGITPADIPLIPSDVKFIIDRDCPILMCLKSIYSPNSMGHMVVITGYGTAAGDYPSLGISAGDVTGILYMDPVTGNETFFEHYGNDSNYIIPVCNYQTGNTEVLYSWTKSVITWRN